jgi:hypothetical protein
MGTTPQRLGCWIGWFYERGLHKTGESKLYIIRRISKPNTKEKLAIVHQLYHKIWFLSTRSLHPSKNFSLSPHTWTFLLRALTVVPTIQVSLNWLLLAMK